RHGAPPRRQRACGRCENGVAERARCLHPARRGPVDLGGAVRGDHRVGSGRAGHAVRADRIEDLPPPEFLRGAGGRRAYVNLRPPELRGEEHLPSVMARESGPPSNPGDYWVARTSRAMTAQRKAGESPIMPKTDQTPLFLYTLRLADDALVLGHRLSEWCGHAPVLEEDLALGNMALDLIGQARSLYAYAGEVEGWGRGCARLSARRRRVPQHPPGRATKRRFRRHHFAPATVHGLRTSLLRSADVLERRNAFGDCGKEREGARLSRAARG